MIPQTAQLIAVLAQRHHYATLAHHPSYSDGLSEGRRGGSRAASTHQIYSDGVLGRFPPLCFEVPRGGSAFPRRACERA